VRSGLLTQIMKSFFQLRQTEKHLENIRKDKKQAPQGRQKQETKIAKGRYKV
jgi:hypothetical protein